MEKTFELISMITHSLGFAKAKELDIKHKIKLYKPQLEKALSILNEIGDYECIQISFLGDGQPTIISNGNIKEEEKIDDSVFGIVSTTYLHED